MILATAIGGLFALMILDYFLHFPAALRVVLLIAAVVGLAYLIWRILVLPLTTRLTDQFLASRVENQNKHLADELTSAVNFIHNRAGSSNALAALHIEMAGEKTAGIRFEDTVDFRPPIRMLGIAVLAFLIVAIIGLANPSLAGIALGRWFTVADPVWPHTTNVAFAWNTPDGKAPRVIPIGEKFTVRAKVDKGNRPRVRLISSVDRNASDTQLMTFQREQSTSNVFYYESALEPDGHELHLRLEAGDNDEVPPVTIAMAPRPVITQMQATIHAPTYAHHISDPNLPAPSTVVNLQSQAGRATQGATVDLQIVASKPFQLNAQGEPDVGLFDQNRDEPLPLALTRSLISPTEARISFKADKTIQCRLLMHDRDGFQNRIGGTVSLEVTPDAPPTLVILEPRRSLERAPNGVVEITLQGTDDWGFSGLRMRADRFDAKPEDAPAFQTDLKWNELTSDAAAGSITGKAVYTWDLAPLHLDAGTRLTFFSLTQDNYVNGEQRHDWVKSSPLALQIRSASDIQEAQRKAISELNDRIKALKIQQEQTKAQTDSIRRIVDTAKSISPEQLGQLANLAQQETQESAAASAVEQRAAQIADELKQNLMQEGDLGKLAQEVAAGMREVGQQNMPRAAADLSKASSPASQPANPAAQSQQSAQSMANASQQQGEAIAKMDDLIKKLGAVGDFESLRNETAKALEQQNQLIKDTQQLSPKVTGMKSESLPKDLRDKLERLAADQQQLSEKTADLLDRMERAAEPMSQSDPASAQSLKSAASAGKNNQVSNSQSTAGKNLSANQTNDAGRNQQIAQQGLQQMMDELNKNDMRKLEQLAREVRKLVEDVQKLRDDQDALNKDTAAAGPAANSQAVQKLANRQGTLQQNTIIVQKKAENTQGAAQAAAFIEEASGHMEKAAAALFSSKQPDAGKPQTDALAALDNALAELKKLESKVNPNLNSKKLAEFVKQYEEIKKDQIAVKGTTEELETRRLAEDDKELDRLDKLKAGGLAITQGGLIDRINGLNKDPELGKIDVVVWMNQQVTESMDVSKTRLEKLQLGKLTASAQQAAVDRIQLIIDALKEEQARQSEFKSPSGGGGGGGGGKPPLVPPIAQLKLLKAMQLVVNDQTKAVDGDLKTATTDADKNEFRTQAQKLGEKEGRIHDMSQDIVNQLLQNQQQGPRPKANNPEPKPQGAS
jgi:hypothetical protein